MARLEADRIWRKLAVELMFDIFNHPADQVGAILQGATALVEVANGVPLTEPVCEEAAVLYSRLRGTTTDRLRTLRILGMYYRYMDEGLFDMDERREFARITGHEPVEQAPHLRVVDPDRETPDGSAEILVAPKPVLSVVR